MSTGTSKELRLTELRAEIAKHGATGWHGCDAKHLFILAQVLDDRAELLKVSYAAWHALQSLLAMRDGITDDLLRDVAGALHTALAKAGGGT